MTKENWVQFWEWTWKRRIEHGDGTYTITTRIGAGWGWTLVALFLGVDLIVLWSKLG